MIYEILKIYLEQQHLIKFYAINHLLFFKIQNMVDITGDLHQWFINLLIKSLLLRVQINRLLYFYSHRDRNKF